MSYQLSEAQVQTAKESVARLIEFYPSIMAANPQTYAAGMVALFSRYPEHLQAEAIDPVHGLPGDYTFLPTIAEAKKFLEPKFLAWQRTQDAIARANRKQLPEPPRDPERDARMAENFKSLGDVLRGLPGSLTLAEQRDRR